MSDYYMQNTYVVTNKFVHECCEVMKKSDNSYQLMITTPRCANYNINSIRYVIPNCSYLTWSIY